MRCLSLPHLSPLALPCPALLPCLQNEVVSILQQQAKIEPGFTQLVWQKLEEQNPEFFRSAISTRCSAISNRLMSRQLPIPLGRLPSLLVLLWSAACCCAARFACP